MTLLQEAKKVAVARDAGKFKRTDGIGAQEMLELALAYLRGEIRLCQVAKVLRVPAGQAKMRMAYWLLCLIKEGKVELTVIETVNDRIGAR